MKTVHPQMAWVVFSDETDLSYLKILKRGFRHCYLLMSDGQKWFSIDPLAHMTQVGFHSFTEPFNLPLWLSGSYDSVMTLFNMMKGKDPAFGAKNAVSGAMDEASLNSMMKDPKYWREKDLCLYR